MEALAHLAAPAEVGSAAPVEWPFMARSSVRLLFCVAAALLAAAIADPIVETASNLGLFGHHNFTDHSTLDVIPTLLIALTFAGIWVIVRVRRSLATTPSAAWSAAASAIDMRSLWRLLPWIFMMQIVVLFAMESIEQVTLYGHLLGPTIWLGGPVLIALSAHAAFCIAVSLFLAAMLRAFAASITRIVEALLRFLSTYRPRRRGFSRLHRRAVVFRPSQPTLGRLGERAPPPLTI